MLIMDKPSALQNQRHQQPAPALACCLAAYAVDESGALSILQWVLSSRPEPAAAEQQLRAAWKMVSCRHMRLRPAGVLVRLLYSNWQVELLLCMRLMWICTTYMNSAASAQHLYHALCKQCVTSAEFCCDAPNCCVAACRLTQGLMDPHGVRCCAWLAALRGPRHCRALHSWQSSVRAGQQRHR
jgi:hypothetical protein